MFGIGNYAVSKWVKQYKETGDLSNKPLNREYKKIDPEKLKASIVEHPDAYQREIAEAFACSAVAVGKALKRHKSITDSTLFEFWFEQYLLPCLPEDAVIVMDNASFHRKKQLTDISARNQRTLIFLPSYSPELNPIENFWAYLKSIIHNSIHTFDSLDDAISFAFQVC